MQRKYVHSWKVIPIFAKTHAVRIGKKMAASNNAYISALMNIMSDFKISIAYLRNFSRLYQKCTYSYIQGRSKEF